MRRFLSLIAAAVLAVSLVTPAMAAGSPVLDRIIESRTVRVGMSGEQPPFSVRDRDGRLMGLEVDLAKTLANALAVKLEIVEKPFGELLGALEKGEVDVVMSGLAITPERARDARFIGPYLLSGKSILTTSQTLAQAGEAGQINQASLRLAALQNSTSQSFIERQLPQAKLVKVARYDDAIEMLKKGEIDALVADLPVCVLAMLQHPEAGFATLDRPLTVEPVGMAVSAADPQFASLVRNYLDAIEESGMLERMRERWLERGEWLERLP